MSAETTADVANLAELCRRQVARRGEERAFVFLESGVVESAALTYAELDVRARAIAVRLRSLAQPGSRALLCHPPGLEFVAAFLGCLYAGIIAVPAPPVRRASGDARHTRLTAIADDCEPALLLSTKDTLAGLQAILGQRPLIPLATDTVTDGGSEWNDTDEQHEIAYLQYTSGTTGRPKGVVLTHAGVLHNLELIVRGGSRPDEDYRRVAPTVSWLPVFHDMGLVGGVLQPLFLGQLSVLMSAQSFARVPANWLRAISRYGAEIAAAPSLGYELCLRRVTDDQRDGLDLSRWRIAAISDEPLHASTIDRFTARFARCGFRRETFFPSYGMAESTVLISGGPLDGQPVVRPFDSAALERGRVERASSGAGARSLVGCGEPDPSLDVVIADPETCTPLGPGEVGEILVSGPSIGAGYWNDPIGTEQTFGALVDGRRFLRTGNLGFLFEGQLFVTCRIPDLLEVDGRQLYPYDVEATAADSHAAVRMACAVMDGSDVVMFVEVDHRHRTTSQDEIRYAVSTAVHAENGVVLSRVALLSPGALPLTTSGKLRRAACRALVLGGK
ncbi:fatty acyl-AMP ligase [Lentzea aerocolonigenes]|uniref:fatty acyl-AMP ligase n=1 Tax=Lentzea aerocolonigenes TaxID=68170 RepID=UPI00068BA592|nr:fatty acyl-AMP ligase [Lentzea aerocolonigenes]MCP2247287.1 Acyl-CoA synthetase (AMP-forming)/AMP-acid ligase II [Lentzea aerocolonigenes]